VIAGGLSVQSKRRPEPLVRVLAKKRASTCLWRDESFDSSTRTRKLGSRLRRKGGYKKWGGRGLILRKNEDASY